MFMLLMLFCFVFMFTMGFFSWEKGAKGWWVWIVLSIPFAVIYLMGIHS